MAQENRSWGYDRIVWALKHLDYTISDQTGGNILKRHRILPAPEGKKTTTWKAFVRSAEDARGYRRPEEGGWLWSSNMRKPLCKPRSSA